MPLYPFRCDRCGQEFDVSRPISRAAEPAACPVDGGPGVRIFTPPVRLTARGQDAPPATAEGSSPGSEGGHAGHSHSPGGHGHSHGPGGHSHGPH
jgi:putative FmdB family regulatory protein